MVKRLVAKTGQYEKDGQTKGEYTEIGVVFLPVLHPRMGIARCVSAGGTR